VRVFEVDIGGIARELRLAGRQAELVEASVMGNGKVV
jgi:hypothetical protein